MWRGYGGKQPIAIVFDDDKLGELITEHTVKNKIQSLYKDVIYASDIKDLVNEANEELAALEPLFMVEDPRQIAFDDAIYRAVVKLAMAVKHPGFHEEKEVRLVITCPDKKHEFAEDEMAEMAKVALDAPIIEQNGKTYFMADFGPAFYGTIKKIVLGPGMADKRELLKKELRKLGCSGIKIIESNIPFKQ